MGLLNSALQIGRSAILGYEAALQVVGSNISSAASPDFTRLSPQLDPLQGGFLTLDLQPGAGVALTAIQRNIDEALEGRVRLAIGEQTSATTQEATLGQLEALFDDLSGSGIGSRLTDFFNVLDEVQNTPEDLAIRDLAVSRGVSVAESIRRLRSQLTQLSESINEQIRVLVGSADSFAREIAQLNQEITTAEAGRNGQATGLRDQRDAVLRRLSELFDVVTREQPDGTVNVYVGNEALVQGSVARGLIAVDEVNGDTIRTSVRFVDTRQQIGVHGGRLEGLILSRDQDSQIQLLDELAAAIIHDVNRVHADGQGLTGFVSLIGSSDLLATDVPLDSPEAGLSFPPTNGSFFLTVTDDATGTPIAHRIDVSLDGTGAGATLESLVTDINSQVAGVTATITADNRIQLDADAGRSFTFGYDGQDPRADTSGVLAALGLNTFFSGDDAKSIAVNEKLIGQSSLLAAASVALPGDGANARRLAALATDVSTQHENESLLSFYRTIANGVAVRGAAVRDVADATETVLGSLEAQRQSISGVSLDEEAIALVKFERAFQGAARFISVVDDLLGELMLLVR